MSRCAHQPIHCPVTRKKTQVEYLHDTMPKNQSYLHQLENSNAKTDPLFLLVYLFLKPAPRQAHEKRGPGSQRRRPGFRRSWGPGRDGGGTSGCLVDDIPLSHALALLRDGCRAGNLAEVDVRVVGALEPVVSPVASGLELLWEAGACALGSDSAVALSPAIGRGTVLVGAG